MIGWLQGRLADRWQQGSRHGLLLLCQGVGYEVQISSRHWIALPASGAELTLVIHQVIREDAWTLYGFSERGERDLFRELVAVSGVGPQLALGLLGCLEPETLVRAIVQADLRLLSSAPGVGKRTAERLSVELRGKLGERFATETFARAQEMDLEGPTLQGPTREEVQITLGALGYEALEINRALRGVGAQGLEPSSSADDWLRESLRWLSQPAA
ncbi:Holliday junction branch migration protein RuvA [Cyanobium sp. Morenito 9A2]|uniref:Holliday junction branch migration protein RuvA n=1 Tax=Cyanobium sp. Morenito 9A2 TaxID=2823718 RepID=UPI0020CE16D0|nr:Holliday junction branch migration protein RuvA [Cyanobium sp. Morenito 9A2]MCP9850482.1 Holliday junction branch migration protein RuvA [Cyanobium sp. Morenito 9A2]